jgi:hypothetical protein
MSRTLPSHQTNPNDLRLHMTPEEAAILWPKGKRKKAHTRFTRELQIRFLQLLATSGLVHNSILAVGLSRAALDKYRKANPEFNEAVEAARECYRDRVRHAVQERAIEGWDEPVFYKGVVVGHIRKFSDRLLEMEAKKHDPGYRDQVSVDATVKAGVLVVPATPQSMEQWVQQNGGSIEDQRKPKELPA